MTINNKYKAGDEVFVVNKGQKTIVQVFIAKIDQIVIEKDGTVKYTIENYYGGPIEENLLIPTSEPGALYNMVCSYLNKEV